MSPLCPRFSPLPITFFNFKSFSVFSFPIWKMSYSSWLQAIETDSGSLEQERSSWKDRKWMRMWRLAIQKSKWAAPERGEQLYPHPRSCHGDSLVGRLHHCSCRTLSLVLWPLLLQIPRAAAATPEQSASLHHLLQTHGSWCRFRWLSLDCAVVF